jgi:hypothetical protein
VKHRFINEKLTIIVDLKKVPLSLAGSRVSGKLTIITSSVPPEEVKYPMTF